MNTNRTTLGTGDELVSRYRVLGVAEAGLVRARDERAECDVAIAWGSAASKHLRRFEHAGVAKLLDEGTHDGTPFVVYEWIEGESLRRNVGASTVSTDQALRWAIDVAAALSAMHEAGIVHGDVRISNWRMKRGAEGERICLLYGGLVHTWDRALSPELAPEQVVKEGVVGRRSDLYSFGATLFELLAGRPILVGENDDDLRMRILSERPPLVTDFRADVPLSLSLLLRHLLRKKASERIASAKEVEDILRKILAGEPWKPVHESSRSLAPLTEERFYVPSVIREPQLRLSIALLFVVACGAALLLYFREWGEPVTAPYQPPSEPLTMQPSQINSASRAVKQLLEKGKEMDKTRDTAREPKPSKL